MTHNHEALNRVQTRLNYLYTDVERVIHLVHTLLHGETGSDVLHQMHSVQASLTEAGFVLRDAGRAVSKAHHPSNGYSSRIVMVD